MSVETLIGPKDLARFEQVCMTFQSVFHAVHGQGSEHQPESLQFGMQIRDVPCPEKRSSKP